MGKSLEALEHIMKQIYTAQKNEITEYHIYSNIADYDKIKDGDILSVKGVRKSLEDNSPIIIHNDTQNFDIETSYDLSDRERQILLAGGKLSYTVASS